MSTSPYQSLFRNAFGRLVLIASDGAEQAEEDGEPGSGLAEKFACHWVFCLGVGDIKVISPFSTGRNAGGFNRGSRLYRSIHTDRRVV